MPTHVDLLRLRLATGPQSGTQMAKDLGISQPTVSRALATMAGEVLQLGQKKGSRYVLRDAGRGFGDVPVFRVDAQGKLKELGLLTPVRPDGYVFTPADSLQVHSDGLPWWLLDILPQGYLGRAYAAHVGTTLGLPSTLKEWTDNGRQPVAGPLRPREIPRHGRAHRPAPARQACGLCTLGRCCGAR